MSSFGSRLASVLRRGFRFLGWLLLGAEAAAHRGVDLLRLEVARTREREFQARTRLELEARGAPGSLSDFVGDPGRLERPLFLRFARLERDGPSHSAELRLDVFHFLRAADG